MNLAAYLDKAFGIYRSRLGLLVSLGVLCFAVSLLTVGLFFGPCAYGFFAVVGRIRRNEAIAVSDVFSGFTRIPDVLLPGIALLVASVVGLFFLILPAAVVLFFLSFSFIRMNEQHADFTSSFLMALDLFKKKPWPVIAVMLVAGILASIGALLSMTIFHFLLRMPFGVLSYVILLLFFGGVSQPLFYLIAYEFYADVTGSEAQ